MTTILAIESSCDETGIGIAELATNGTVTLLADEVASSVDEHARFGGVVPEIASRAHLEALGPTMRRALDAAGIVCTRRHGLLRIAPHLHVDEADMTRVADTIAAAMRG